MNTAYRVWDGRQMHYWDEPGMSLEFIGTHWFLRHTDSKGHKNIITGSHEEGTALMWGTDIRLLGQLVDPEKCIYAPGKMIYESDLILRYDYNPDVYMKDKFIGEVKMIEGSWCVVNDKEKISVLLFSETAEDALFGNIYENVTAEGAE
ncbi:YopX family protein [Bacillus sp. 3A_MP1]